MENECAQIVTELGEFAEIYFFAFFLIFYFFANSTTATFAKFPRNVNVI
jgi:hypothetical protein